MAIWGDGLFESDDALDIISAIDHNAEMSLLETKIRERIEAAHKDHVKAGQVSTDEENPLECHCEQMLDCLIVSIYHCEGNEDLVREHLKAPPTTGVAESRAISLANMYMSGMYSENYGDRVVYLGMCYMQLGLVLPDGLHNSMKQIYKTLELRDDALEQVKHALDTYVHDEEFDFGSRGLLETAKVKKRKLQLDDDDKDGGCAGCGRSKRKDGMPLLVCGGCKQVEYCGRDCQKKCFKDHKLACGNLSEET